MQGYNIKNILMRGDNRCKRMKIIPGEDIAGKAGFLPFSSFFPPRLETLFSRKLGMSIKRAKGSFWVLVPICA